MKSRFFSLVMMTMLLILSVKCRPLPLTATAQTPLFHPFTMATEQGGIGSSPPNCEHKCYGCSPCEAAQVPTTGGHVGVGMGVGIQYSNYEPEAWKCKCGPTFYSP